MSPLIYGVLVAAGVIAGTLNALAGGGTFVAFSAFAFAGLPASSANASTTIALLPGTLSSAWAYRCEVEPLGISTSRTLAILSFAGGVVGALLLLSTPELIFSGLLPWLLLFATIVLATGGRLGHVLRRLGLRLGPSFAMVMQFLLGVYGGYFGGAVGLMMLATWSLVKVIDLKAMAPLRSIMVSAANAAAVMCFMVVGDVEWRAVLAVACGAIAGGYFGAQIGRKIPALVLRAGTLAIAIATTVVFFIRAYA